MIEFYVTRDGENLNLTQTNAVFSSIYGAVVPKDESPKRTEYKEYDKFSNLKYKFIALPCKILNKLKDYGLVLKRIN